MMTEGVHSCEYESKSFLEDKDKTDKKLIENLIECLNTESQQKVLVIESSNKTLESCGFKTNFLCENADCNEEEIQTLENWLSKSGNTEDCVEFPETIPSELVNLWKEIMLLEMRLSNQQKFIQDVKLELKKDEEVVMTGNDEKDAEIHGEQGKIFMVGELNILYDQSYANIGNEERRIVSKDNNDEQTAMEQKYKIVDEEEIENDILEEGYVFNGIEDEREQLLKVVMERRRNGEDGTQQFDEILGGCQEKAELPDGSKLSFHWLKENTEKEIVLRNSMAVQNRAEDDEGSNSESVVQQRKEPLEVFYTSGRMKVAEEKGIQTEVFQQRSKLDEEIDKLWYLMQRCKRHNASEVQTVIWMTMEDCEDHGRVDEQQQLQSKVWDPGGLRISVT